MYPKYYYFGKTIYKIISEKEYFAIRPEPLYEAAFSSDETASRCIETISTHGDEVPEEMWIEEKNQFINKLNS